MPKIVDLRQDRSLICSNFDGYKLSLESVPLLREELQTGPHKASASEEQYSLLHAELFAIQNLLQVDPWERTCSYFVNQSGEVVRSSYNENTGRPEVLQVVYRLTSFAQHKKGDYNYSLRFISEKFAVLCNGIQELLLLDTGDRLKAPEWQEKAKAQISDTEHNFLLFDCRLDVIQEQKEISLALGRVQRVENDETTSHYMHIHWAKWVQKDTTWQFEIKDTLEGKGSIYYCAFEPRAESLVISSNHELVFRSQKAILSVEDEPSKPEAVEERPHLHGDAKDIGGFSWTQNTDDIVLKFKVPEGKGKEDFTVKSTNEDISVKCLEKTLLDSALFAKVDQELTTWAIENKFLQITLIKQDSALYWPSLLPDGAGPIETLEKGEASTIPIEQQPIANLEAPVEECDFPIGANEEDIKIERFNLPTKSITHAVLLGATPPLFATSLRPGFPLAVAIRQDVDAGLWLQQYNPAKPEEWSLRHDGNLHAFGYVQASKQQKKFMDCSPDLNYAIICESHRHIFLYKAQYDTATGLRNRNGPQVTLGKQHLITLEDAGEVLGICTAPTVVTLLTERAVLYLQIN